MYLCICEKKNCQFLFEKIYRISFISINNNDSNKFKAPSNKIIIAMSVIVGKPRIYPSAIDLLCRRISYYPEDTYLTKIF